MNRYTFVILTFSILLLYSLAFARGLTFSGISETSISTNVGAGEDADPFTYGVEEYANIRMQSKIGEKGTFFGAVNLIASTGDYALKASALGVDFAAGENYIATMELERLYFKLKGENIDFDGGLLRLPFGYSTIWGPSDFLNPKNPLKPDARPRAILGGVFSYYPIKDLKLLGFASASRDPFASNSGIAGASAEQHWKKASVQALYSFERSEIFPGGADNPWTHRMGMSVKADVKAGLLMDMLYVYNQGIEDKADGLSFSAGFDYSLFDANLMVHAEYLYNGLSSSTSLIGGGDFTNNNYLYAGAAWRFNDFTNVSFAVIACLDDISFVPLVGFNYDLFQGATLSFMAQIHIDRDLFFDDGNRGEFGRLPPGVNAGSSFYMESKLKLRF